jgi:hypothetical protein
MVVVQDKTTKVKNPRPSKIPLSGARPGFDLSQQE